MGHRVKRLAHSFFYSFVDFVYPPLCLLCKNRLDPNTRFVCDSCWAFNILEQPKLPLEQLDVLQNKVAHFEHSIAIYEFSETIQDLIHIMKYKDLPGICLRFGRDIGELCFERHLLNDIDIIAPVPLHSLRYRERGYNQAGLIAREIGRFNNIMVDEKLLKRVRYTNQQAKFNKEERAENVRDAFALKSGVNINKKKVAIVDDVLTTGSTMNECAKILKNNGANKVIVITIVRI